jgi:hypothetical protein
VADKPDYIVNAKFDADASENKIRYVTIGAAWNSSTRDDRPCINIQINSLPIGKWDGKLTLYEIRDSNG